VSSAFHSIKAVFSQLGALWMGLQAKYPLYISNAALFVHMSALLTRKQNNFLA